MRIAGSLLAFVAVVVTSPTFAETIQLASVQVNDPICRGIVSRDLVTDPRRRSLNLLARDPSRFE